MSLCLRPVVETWGESITYSSRDTDITEVIGRICDYAEEQRGITDEPLSYETCEYGDVQAVWISNGHAFLNYLAANPLDEIMICLADDDTTSSDDEEYERQKSDVADMKAMAQSWRSSIDPQDGSLRLYCD